MSDTGHADRPDVPEAIEPRGRPLTDGGAVALAAAVVLGAFWHGPVPLWWGAVSGGVALVLGRPRLLVVAGFLAAASLADRSFDGLGPAPHGTYEGPVTLITDPKQTPYGVRVDVRVGDRRFEMTAGGGAAGTVGRALAGERLMVSGRTSPRPDDAPWLVPRHVVGRLEVRSAEALDGGSAPWRAANRFRRLLVRGAEPLPEPTRSLYGGFVLGDDRGQPPEVIDDFRASGLSHLLVVSGQNVAFVLVLAAPLIRRLGLFGRWATTLAVIAAFGVLTRFEPSVLRASAMAAVAVTATVAGRPAATVRTLALAVAGLVLVDPLLVWSVAFQLSTAASLGIAVLGPWIGERLPGPRWWRETLGVTLAAQAGVAPVLIPRFGGLPVVSIVANILAVPVSGLVTTWGLPAGVVAGTFGPPVAGVVHAPTRLLIDWVAGVARVTARMPLGEVGVREMIALVVGVGGLLAVRRRRPDLRAVRTALGAVAVAAVLAPGLALRTPPAEVTVAGGSKVQRRDGTTVLVLSPSSGTLALLEDLRRAGVRRIDVVLADRRPRPEVLRALRHRWPVGPVIVGPVDR